MAPAPFVVQVLRPPDPFQLFDDDIEKVSRNTFPVTCAPRSKVKVTPLMPPPLPAATWAVTTAGSVLLGEIGLIVMFETVGGGTKAMPERLMSKDGLPASLLAMCKTAVFVPKVDALNCTVKVEVPLFAATGVVGEVVTEKLALFVPSMVTPVMSSGVLPVFVIVKVFESVLPTFTLP